MAKKFIAGKLKCNKCNEDAQFSMYEYKGQIVCRKCALEILGGTPDEVH